ncbi:MAG TPA: TPM domain-containing protein [Rhodocyclaceae bacterium]|nr:TPM domain-containing protein [Rhodocyclaceae bacterium]
MAALGRMPLLLLLLLCCSWAAGAAEPIPPLTARVTDRTGTLAPDQVATLERSLEAFEARRGTQIAVLMVPTTREEPIEQYALRAAEQWKLGRKGVDDGALLVVAKDDRALRIEVGYGLEGVLTDATSKRIISDIIVPRFRQGDFYGGVRDGLDRMMRVAEGESLPAPDRRTARQGAGEGSIMQHLPLIIVVALVLGGMLRAVLGRLLGATATGGIAAMLAWWMAGALSLALVAGLAAFFLTLFSGFGHRGGWPLGGWGGGGFGGGGFGTGGGFRGGGGGFGGGGASGRW